MGLGPISEESAAEEHKVSGVLRGWWVVLSNTHVRTISAMYFFLKMTRYALLFWLLIYLIQTSHLSNRRGIPLADGPR